MKEEDMLNELKNIYSKLATSFREKKLKKQKVLIQMKMMACCIKRVK